MKVFLHCHPIYLFFLNHVSLNLSYFWALLLNCLSGFHQKRNFKMFRIITLCSLNDIIFQDSNIHASFSTFSRYENFKHDQHNMKHIFWLEYATISC